MHRDTQRRLDEFRLTRATEHENELIDELATGQIDRETFLRQGAMIGLSVGALGSVLGASASAPSSRRPRARRRRGSAARCGSRSRSPRARSTR